MATRSKSATKAPATKKAQATKKAPTVKKTATKKASAKPAPAAKASKGATGPRTNPTYVAKTTDRRLFDGSARTKVYAFVSEAGTKGIDREAIEKQFAGDESVNVKSALGYLVKMEMMVKVEKL